jgi:phosphate:Na+ symporter
MGIASVITLLGGLAFFLFGMSLMGEALKKVAGGRLETTLGRLTSTPLRGVLLGTLVTAVIQSSSATSVMVVGFVNSGIMTLTGAIPIVMGANIGTTATGWLLSLASVGGSGAAGLLSASVLFALVAVIGILVYMTARTVQRRNAAVVLLALSVLMSGMKTMSSAMEPLQENATFVGMLTAVSNPLACVVIGIAVTAVIQSCSASIGILQALAITGAVQWEAAVYLVVGMSVGACVPVLLSAMGASKDGKRTAFTYLYFDALGGTVFLAVFLALRAAGVTLMPSGSATSVGIAVINTVFKVFAVAVLLPFRSVLEKLAIRTFPDDPQAAAEAEAGPDPMDSRFLRYPALALEQAGAATARMAADARKNLEESVALLSSFDEPGFARVQSREEQVDRFEDRIGTYLVQLSARELTEEQTRRSARLLQSLTNLERISDHAMNIAELAQELHGRGQRFSDEASTALALCAQAVEEIVSLAFGSLTENNLDDAVQVEPLEDTIDLLTERLKAQHVERLQCGRCTLEMGFVFNDCINNFERVADHCSNIALIVLETNCGDDVSSHRYAEDLKAADTEEYRTLSRTFAEKYLARVPGAPAQSR